MRTANVGKRFRETGRSEAAGPRKVLMSITQEYFLRKRFLTTLRANATTCIIGLERSAALAGVLPLSGKVPLVWKSRSPVASPVVSLVF
jgi:hypothetical protein